MAKGKATDQSPICCHDDTINSSRYLVKREKGCVDNKLWLLKIKGRNGRAFLFSHAMNIVVGPKEDRHLMTGLHTVADVHCCDCREVLGWKYERAYEEAQKYKEGKFVLEKSKIVKENW
ncbi:hypothetical protein KY290_033348 [Solanum tuberosum]|uniref:Protein yippee-like n=1 Tax=Solanum tuberosum TaxID=4113 RepID=A0ABQ7U0A7_SOLTU|nr:hypothetical protein KY289_032712 [Solanum tuberosum]KAH0646517.1 hypothetical protein KY284_034401 [Solanum tuberosum]KAH0740305.1 hypothetical protein KY290_033348 [Solanum tuberosum]